jgi:RNA polymerase sigma factor (sigma-70 family)
MTIRDPRHATSHERLVQAVARLRSLEREVLLLSAGERLSNAEIGQRLKLAPDEVERLLARALLKLDRRLARRRRPWRRFWRTLLTTIFRGEGS